MMKESLLGLGALIFSAASVQAATIVLPVTGGSFGGMNTLNGDGSWNSNTALYHNMADVLDNQPTSFDGTGTPIGQPKVGGDNWGTASSAYPGGWGYIDFGANWADVRITQAWTQSRAWTAGPATPYTELYWSANYATWIQNTGATPTIPSAPAWANYMVKPVDAVAETTINFVTNATPGGDAWGWQQDLNLPEANAVAPQGRYLVMHSAQPGTGFQEIALGGLIVPEPATLSLAGAAITGMVLRRRRSA